MASITLVTVRLMMPGLPFISVRFAVNTVGLIEEIDCANVE
jgi:hypothetical protein